MAKYPKEFSVTGEKSTLYRTWYDMKLRCSGKLPRYENTYTLKGIKVCPEWSDLVVFAKWAETAGWEKGLEIDRVDNSKGYYPANCRFSNHMIQNSNRDLEQAHRNIKASQTKRHAKPFICVDTGTKYLTQIEASRDTGVDRKALRMALLGKYRQAGGYSWKYMEAS